MGETYNFHFDMVDVAQELIRARGIKILNDNAAIFTKQSSSLIIVYI